MITSFSYSVPLCEREVFVLEQNGLASSKKHFVTIEDRNRVLVNGAVEVDSFDENHVVAVTELGVLVVKGSQLHLQRLSVESGDIAVEGRIDSVAYLQNDARKSSSFFGKMFR